MENTPEATAKTMCRHAEEISLEAVLEFSAFIGLTRAAPQRCSAVLQFELYAHTFLIPDGGGVHAEKVVAEIVALEGGNPTRTKPEEPFERLPLKGLWKKHYLRSGGRSVAANVKIGLGRKSNRLREIIKRYHNPASNLSAAAKAAAIAKDVVAIYEERGLSKQLTGEWVVFAQHDGRNYYLCLASHRERDDCIFRRAKAICCAEFPDLAAALGYMP